MTDDRKTIDAEAVGMLAREDQIKRDWTLDAECLVAFHSTLRKGGLPDDLASVLTTNAQIQYYNQANEDDDD